MCGVQSATRPSVPPLAAVRKAKKAIRKAFENSMAGTGLSFVEIVATFNSGWNLTPVKYNEWMVEHMFPEYPLGDLKDNGEIVAK